MPLTLFLGTIDIPYTAPPKPPGEAKKNEEPPKMPTTGQVAEWLENRLHPMEHFYQYSQEKIATHVADALAGALESAAMGAPSDGMDPLAAAGEAITADFKQFLALDTLASLGYPGLPTKAALDGVNHRMASGFMKGNHKRGKGFIGPRMPPRPSLIDTGLYAASMRSWFEQS